MLRRERKVFLVTPEKYYPLSHPATIIADQYIERALFSIPFQSPDGTISFETANDQPISISIPFSGTLPLSARFTDRQPISISHLWSMSYFM